jgi:hypothetical protein
MTVYRYDPEEPNVMRAVPPTNLVIPLPPGMKAPKRPAVEFMRRGNQVALVANGLVIHLDPGTARAIGKMLIDLANDIETTERDASLLEAFG